MHFRQAPDLPARPMRDRRWWATVLFLSAAAAAIATRGPWIRVRFERLFSAQSGPPGWQTTAGFTCLCTSMLVVVLALVESGSATSREAVRPASALLTAIALLTMFCTEMAGPGQLAGVSAIWTSWFYVAGASLPVLAGICAVRWFAARGRSPQS